jgi:chorismate dehydratase
MSTKIGFIKYSNCFPLYWTFKTRRSPRPEIILGYPSQLNFLLRSQKLALSAISSVEYARAQSQYLLIDNISLNSRGYIKSVLFLSHKRIENLSGKKIVLTPASATSQIVLKILLDFFKNKKVSYISSPLPEAVGILLIGDEALKYENKIYSFQYDLGKLWEEIFCQPIIFALWAVNKSAWQKNKKMINYYAQEIIWAKENLNFNSPQFIKAAIKQYPQLKIDFKEYYQRLGYNLREEEKSAFLFLIERASKLNLSPPLKKLEFLP